MSKKLKKPKGMKISTGPRHQLTEAEKSRGGKRGSQTLWERDRELKKARKAESATSADDFRKLGLQFALELESAPPLHISAQRLMKQQLEAREYPPGVWTSDKKIWKERKAEMEGSEVPEADREEDASP